MVEALDQQFGDRFTAYLTSSEYAELRATLSGQRGGSIGVAVEARCSGGTACARGVSPSELVFEDVLTGQPAARAGIRPGDVLLAVGSVHVSMSDGTESALRRASSLIRGAAGTTVRITVVRAGSQRTFTVRRANLHLPSVFSARFGKVLYLQVSGFDDGTADAARGVLRKALSSGATSVILDLRHNGGGFVAEAQQLASQFLRPGRDRQDVVIRRGRLSPGGRASTAQTVVHDKILGGGAATSVPLVVLVDSQTASAAEIVTAALNDYQRATVIGERTFGKGSVQLDFPLPDGSDLHLTVERWYGPRGESIDGAGITPAQTVLLASPDQRFQLNAISGPASADAQLRAALALLHSSLH
jgi:carboxyl-terminal processing protease